MEDEHLHEKTAAGESVQDLPTCDCKVGQTAREHCLEGIDAELIRRWHGKGIERQSLRTMTAYFNIQVFRGVLEAADADILETQIGHLYDVLTGDTATEGERVEVVNRLQAMGIDVAALQQKKFVSYQTIHNHLRDCLGISSPTQNDSETTWEADQESLRAIRGRTERIAESMVDRNLQNQVSESLDITVNVMARCNDCGYHKPVTTLLEEGDCDCEEHT